MDALLRDQNVWQTQNDVDQTLCFGNEHFPTLDTWKKRARPAMIFFVEYCWRHYNEKPRCAVCGCLLRGSGKGHLQSRNHLKRLKEFIGVWPPSFTDRDDYWQVVRHRSGAARINHIDLQIQTCVGQPPPYKLRQEELHGAGAFVQWKMACFSHGFREHPCVLKIHAGKRSECSKSIAEADIDKRLLVGLTREKIHAAIPCSSLL